MCKCIVVPVGHIATATVICSIMVIMVWYALLRSRSYLLVFGSFLLLYFVVVAVVCLFVCVALSPRGFYPSRTLANTNEFMARIKIIWNFKLAYNYLNNSSAQVYLNRLAHYYILLYITYMKFYIGSVDEMSMSCLPWLPPVPSHRIPYLYISIIHRHMNRVYIFIYIVSYNIMCIPPHRNYATLRAPYREYINMHFVQNV